MLDSIEGPPELSGFDLLRPWVQTVEPIQILTSFCIQKSSLFLPSRGFCHRPTAKEPGYYLSCCSCHCSSGHFINLLLGALFFQSGYDQPIIIFVIGLTAMYRSQFIFPSLVILACNDATNPPPPPQK